MKLIESLVFKEVVQKRVYYTVLNEVGMIPCFLYLNYLPSLTFLAQKDKVGGSLYYMHAYGIAWLKYLEQIQYLSYY